MSSNAQRFASAVLQRFAELGLITDSEVGDARGPSTSTMTKLRKAARGEYDDMPEPRGDTMKRIDDAARWVIGSTRALWRDGKQPVPFVTKPPTGDPLEDMAARRGDPTRPRLTWDGIEGYVQSLEDRILELEERVDIIELERKSERPGNVSHLPTTPDLAEAALVEEEPAGGSEFDE